MKPIPVAGSAEGWLAAQSTAIRKALKTLDADDDRRLQFAAEAAQAGVGRVEDIERLELLYEFWLSVPSRMLFKATPALSREELLRWLDLGSRALLTQVDVEEFETVHGLEDPTDEIETWLRDRAYRNDLTALTGD